MVFPPSCGDAAFKLSFGSIPARPLPTLRIYKDLLRDSKLLFFISLWIGLLRLGQRVVDGHSIEEDILSRRLREVSMVAGIGPGQM